MRKNLRLYYGEVELFAGMVLTFVLAILAVLLFTGCTVIRNGLPGGGSQVVYTVAYPWMNTAMTAKSMNQSSKTNGTSTASMREPSMETTGATNLVTITGDVAALAKLLAK